MEKYAKLNAVKFGIAGGIVTAICVFLTTLAGVYGIFSEYSALAATWLSSIYGFLGYEVSWIGAILGAIYSFIDGFIFIWVFALIYNKLIK